MSDNKESSVLFSLNDLMGLEEDRIRQEEQAKTNAVKAAEAARLAAERAKVDQEEARMRAEQERLRLDELRRKEEDARLVAIQEAELAKAKADAENQARLAAMKEQQEHQRRLEELRQDQGKKKLKIAVGSVAALLVAAIGLFVFFSVQNSREQERQNAMRIEAENRVESERKRADEENRRRDEAQKALLEEITNLKDKLEQAGSVEARAKIQQEIDAKMKGGTGRRPPTGKGPDKPKCDCDRNDPMCSCF
ncbi:MAG: hypothetical protein RJA70_4868 [Pseudomonadota bacterium]|jgi:colicin import membrane protein